MRVLYISGIDGDTRRYRCVHSQEQLALAGIESTLREADDLRLYVDATEYDLLILHRVPFSDLIGDIIEIAHTLAKVVVFETDDLIWRPDLLQEMAILDTLSTSDAHRLERDMVDLRETLRRCDCAMVSTSYLAERIDAENMPAYVHRNGCSEEMIRVAEPAYESHLRNRSDGQDVVIAYFSGTGSHNRDFATVTDVVLDVMRTHPNVSLHVSGHLDLSPAFHEYSERIRRAPYVSWRELPQLLAKVDINLAPLELDNPFCRAKSEAKYSEAALVAVPTIASPVPAFEHAITHGVNGMLAADQTEWRLALNELIRDPLFRHSLGEAARNHVYSEYVPSARSKDLVATLDRINREIEVEGADPVEAPAVVARCMIRRINRLDKTVRQQEAQLENLRRTLAEWETNRESNFWHDEWRRTERLYADDLRHIIARLHEGK